MNFPDIAIAGFGVLDKSGFHSVSGSFPWGADQCGPADVQRSQVLSKMYPGFGKLNLPDRLAFSAASLALSTMNRFDGSKTGITCGIPLGSQSTDIAYMESVLSGTASPALFSATLPSSSIADIAIYFGIKGPDRVIAGSDSAALCALESAIMMLVNKKCQYALCVLVWESSSGSCEHAPAGDDSNSAVAILLELSQTDSHTTILKYDCTATGPVSVSTTEWQIFSALVAALIQKGSCRIPVSESGFKGYISIENNR